MSMRSIGAAVVGAAVIGLSVGIAPSQAVTLYTTDFIPDATRTNFNGFEGITTPFYDGSAGYVEDGIKVEQVNGDLTSGGIWTGYLPLGFEGSRAWYPNGGDFGYTKITRADGNDFVDIGFLIGNGSRFETTYVYSLLKNGVSVFSGTLFGDSRFGGYLGFSGGGFNELRLGNYSGRNSAQTLSGFNALAIDSIELSGSPTAIPTPALLPGLIGIGIAAIRKRKAEQKEAVEV